MIFFSRKIEHGECRERDRPNEKSPRLTGAMVPGYTAHGLTLGMKNAARKWDRCRMDYRPAAAAVSSSYIPQLQIIRKQYRRTFQSVHPVSLFSSPMLRGRGGRENLKRRTPEHILINKQTVFIIVVEDSYYYRAPPYSKSEPSPRPTPFPRRARPPPCPSAIMATELLCLVCSQYAV